MSNTIFEIDKVYRTYHDLFEPLSERAFEYIQWVNLPNDYLYKQTKTSITFKFNLHYKLILIAGIIESPRDCFAWRTTAFLLHSTKATVKKESLLTRRERSSLIVIGKAFLSKVGQGDVSFNFDSGACVAWKAVSKDDVPVIQVAFQSRECGNACGFQKPYGFVPEDGCPIHDPDLGGHIDQLKVIEGGEEE